MILSTTIIGKKSVKAPVAPHFWQNISQCESLWWQQNLRRKNSKGFFFFAQNMLHRDDHIGEHFFQVLEEYLVSFFMQDGHYGMARKEFEKMFCYIPFP